RTAVLMDKYKDHVCPASPPVVVQKLLFAILTPVGKLLINSVNQPYQNRGTVIVTFNDHNKIIEIHDYLDTEELEIVGQSDNYSSLDSEVQAVRARVGLP
ncbi:MAG TPA: hypothetical protein VJL89_02045, partial [Thermodesulfovibrionia bacterium]|nr:hypothetical protein [Thermodesulfovibrionia bacterium]